MGMGRTPEEAFESLISGELPQEGVPEAVISEAISHFAAVTRRASCQERSLSERSTPLRDPSSQSGSPPSRNGAAAGAVAAAGVEREGARAEVGVAPQSEFLTAVRQVIQDTVQLDQEAAREAREAARQERDPLPVSSDGMGGGLAGIKFEQALPILRDSDTDFDRHWRKFESIIDCHCVSRGAKARPYDILIVYRQ